MVLRGRKDVKCLRQSPSDGHFADMVTDAVSSVPFFRFVILRVTLICLQQIAGVQYSSLGGTDQIKMSEICDVDARGGG